MSLYLIINILVISGPFFLSFDKKVAFFKKWNPVLKSIFLVGFLFVLGDIVYTHYGFWGFNSEYLTGLNLGNLPIEEVLFFITIPYACMFIYECVKAYFPNIKDISRFVLSLYLLLGLFLVFNFEQAYSFVSGLFTIILIIYLWKTKPAFLASLSLMLIIAILPFLIVNGILTGSFIEGEIVWYNPSAISNFRVATIPIEDFSYGFNLLVLNVLFYEKFSRK